MIQARRQTDKVVDEKSAAHDDRKSASKDVADAKPPQGGTAQPAAAPAKRSLGTKEIIPFRWKLLGESRGAILTLFKAIERPEVEAQFERVQRDGNYCKLRIVDADMKIEQPQPPRPHKQAAKKAEKPDRAAKTAKATRATQGDKDSQVDEEDRRCRQTHGQGKESRGEQDRQEDHEENSHRFYKAQDRQGREEENRQHRQKENCPGQVNQESE